MQKVHHQSNQGVGNNVKKGGKLQARQFLRIPGKISHLIKLLLEARD
jgi:hypothetical protein